MAVNVGSCVPRAYLRVRAIFTRGSIRVIDDTTQGEYPLLGPSTFISIRSERVSLSVLLGDPACGSPMLWITPLATIWVDLLATGPSSDRHSAGRTYQQVLTNANLERQVEDVPFSYSSEMRLQS